MVLQNVNNAGYAQIATSWRVVYRFATPSTDKSFEAPG